MYLEVRYCITCADSDTASTIDSFLKMSEQNGPSKAILFTQTLLHHTVRYR